MTDKRTFSVLVVSSGEKFNLALKDVLTPDRFDTVHIESSVGAARRRLIDSSYDIIIVNSPLQDEFGADFALDMARDSGSGVLLCVKSEFFDEISDKVSDYGILTVAKPTTRQTLNQSLRLLCATNERLHKIKKENASFEEKIREIKLTNRAKLLLMENLSMSENEAHKYIEREAMNTRHTKAEVAETIISQYTGGAS